MSSDSSNVPTVRIDTSTSGPKPQRQNDPAPTSGPAYYDELGSAGPTWDEVDYGSGRTTNPSPSVPDTVGPAFAGSGAAWHSQGTADTVLGAQGGGSGMPVDRTIVIHPDRKPAIAWLVVANGPYAGHLYSLTGDKQLLGREGAEIVLGDPSVSGRHAAIWSEENDEGEVVFMIQDTASSNGTWVNDEEILRHTLKDKDRVTLGDTDLIFKQA